MPHSIPSAPVQNRILLALTAADRDRLLGVLEPVELPLHQVLHEAGESIRHVYFVEDGVVSQLAPLEGGQEIEVGLIDREGLVGFAAALGAETTNTEAMVQMPGRALRMSAEALRAEMERGGLVPARILRFVHTMLVQTSQVAACNIRHTLDERLARWFLMMHDRAHVDRMPITHEFMAMMLGVRRAGVTVAVNTLAKSGAIAQERGFVNVLDRSRLEGASCECYQAIRQEVDRVLG
ncbi:Crp/Fnr family transcriptional regulator [Indioceanicola profundi]|uniref:Crp/Fnr family transcriptional regulator n=1 Tax=Indioceanicola profundi TaxID=2220096 RepID=UPI0013C41F1F|nr:Crp/Fnr family transcriptional regulator [Indioceanicola profundi]